MPVEFWFYIFKFNYSCRKAYCNQTWISDAFWELLCNFLFKDLLLWSWSQTMSSCVNVKPYPKARQILWFPIYNIICFNAVLLHLCRYYSASIIRMSGVEDDSTVIWLSAVVAFVNFLFTLVGVYLVERVGRRVLTLGSFTGMCRKPGTDNPIQLQGRIQDFHLGGGGGGDAKDYVPARTLRARNRTHFRQGSRALAALGLF